MATGLMSAGPGIQEGGAGGIGGLIYKNPRFATANLDQGTEKLISDEASKAKEYSEDYYAQKFLEGTSQRPDLTASQSYSNALGGPTDDAMKAAISGRAQRQMDFSLNQLQRQAQIAGHAQRAKQSQGAFSAVARREAQMNAANQADIQAALNNQQTRSSIISGLFGAAGTAAGFMGGGAGKPPTSSGSGNGPGIAGGSNMANNDEWAQFTGANKWG